MYICLDILSNSFVPIVLIMSLISCANSPVNSEDSKSLNFSDDIEVARARTDSDLKSEEILCNYGDNIVLDDASEDVDNDIHKPISDKVLGQVRYFVRNKITTEQVAFDISPIDSKQSETPSNSEECSSGKFLHFYIRLIDLNC